MAEGRVRLRATFDEEALLYDRERPGYPERLFDDLLALAAAPPGGRILEIGCGTGQATLPLARRGYRVRCVELGERLAAVARRNLAGYPAVEVETADFETWPAPDAAFDLATSGTALHWIDPAIRYRKIARTLGPGGAVAPFWYAHVRAGEDSGFFDEVQGVYERVAPQIAGPSSERLLRPEDVPADEVGRIDETGLYGPVAVRRYPFEIEYDAASYTRLLATYSGHRALRSEVRERLFGEIADLIDTEYGGRITKGYLAILYVARRV